VKTAKRLKKLSAIAAVVLLLGAKCEGKIAKSNEVAEEEVTEIVIKEQGTPENLKPGASNLSIIKNTIWLLSEIKIGYGSIAIDRALLERDNCGDYFSIQFVNEGINGKAAPNRYFAPYALISGNEVALRPIVGTLMSATVNVANSLTERDYYQYLQAAYRWEWARGALFIYSTTEGGEDAILIYIPKK